MGSASARAQKLAQAPEQFLRDSRSLTLRLVGSAAARVLRGAQWAPDWAHEVVRAARGFSPLERLVRAGAERAAARRRASIEEAGRPLVSIVMAARDAGATIEAALGSLLKQTYSRLEIIVVDDGSDDDTVARVKIIRDPRIQIVRVARPGGAAHARNHGLARARGDFITFHDADDVCHPERIERQLAALVDNPEARVCVCNGRRVDRSGRPVAINGRRDRKALISMMFPRRVLIDLGYFLPYPVGEDSEYFERIKLVYGARTELRLYTPLYFAGFHPGSLLFSHGQTELDAPGEVRHRPSPEARACRDRARAFHDSIRHGEDSSFVGFSVVRPGRPAPMTAPPLQKAG